MAFKIGDRVAFQTGTRIQTGTIVKIYSLPQTKTTEVQAASIQTETNLWSQIPLTRLSPVL